MFHVECTCPTAIQISMFKALHRCDGCHGYKIHGALPESAVCTQCCRMAANVCAVCIMGIHMIGECHLAHGANGAYGRLPKENISVCPDCAWEWVTYINKDPCKALTEQESEAKAIMNGHAIDACPRRRQAVQEIKKHAVNENHES